MSTLTTIKSSPDPQYLQIPSFDFFQNSEAIILLPLKHTKTKETEYLTQGCIHTFGVDSLGKNKVYSHYSLTTQM